MGEGKDHNTDMADNNMGMAAVRIEMDLLPNLPEMEEIQILRDDDLDDDLTDNFDAMRMPPSCLV